MMLPNYLGDDGLVHGVVFIWSRRMLACSWYAAPVQISGIAEADGEPVTCLPCLVEVLSHGAK